MGRPHLFFNLILNKTNNETEMRQFAVILLLALGFAPKAGAQAFINELEKAKPGQGTVVVNQSAAIDDLVNNAKLARTQPAATQPKTEDKGETAEKKPAERQRNEQASNTRKEDAAAERKASTRNSDEAASSAVDTSKKVMRNARKVVGYRVQAYSGGNSRADRQRAESIGNAIKMRFPDLPIYVHFYSPRWICRVGNFRTYQEANDVLKEIKDMGYRQACIVKGKITIGY